jgi:amidophosphoribosyltransferase
MLEELNHECGVAAVSLKDNKGTEDKALFYLYKLLLNLQHRGQLSAGVTTYNKNRAQLIDTYRNIGTVNEVFKTSLTEKSMGLFKKYAGNKGIGHVRYATFGKNKKMYAHPFERHHGRLWKWFSFCFNGNLVNYVPLRDELEKKKEYHFIYDNDTEIVMHYLARDLTFDSGSRRSRMSKPDLRLVFKDLSERFEGAYNIAFMNALGEMVVYRDPYGFRPMSYAIKDGNLLAASESNALINCGYENYKALNPGEMIHVHNGSIEIKKCSKCPRKAHCMFEWVYFANVSSVLDGRSVYMCRTNLGKELAKLETEDVGKDHIVVPVPDSAKAAGDSLAYELGVPSREGLIRNRFVGRTFIEGSSRKDKIQSKYTMVKEILKDKKVLLCDDSIVRGATTEELVSALKEDGGAKEVHVRVSCPPIIGPCFYGIDMSTVNELLAPKFMKEAADSMPEKSAEKMAKHLNADSVIYQTIPGLVRSIGLPKTDLCMACLNREYITPLGKQLAKIAIENFKKGIKETSRTYETAIRCSC